MVGRDIEQLTEGYEVGTGISHREQKKSCPFTLILLAS